MSPQSVSSSSSNTHCPNLFLSRTNHLGRQACSTPDGGGAGIIGGTPSRARPSILLRRSASIPLTRDLRPASIPLSKDLKPASIPLAKDLKPASRTTLSHRVVSSTTCVRGLGSHTGKSPGKPFQDSPRDLGSKPRRRASTLVNTDRLVRRVSSPTASGHLARSSKLVSSSSATSSPPASPLRSPALRKKGRRLTDAHETPPPFCRKTTQQENEDQDEKKEDDVMKEEEDIVEKENPLKMQEELMGHGRQLGGLARRLDIYNTKEKENIGLADTTSYFKEDRARAGHIEETSRLVLSLYYQSSRVLIWPAKKHTQPKV